MLFFLFWAGLMFITGYAITAGAAERLVFGYDSYGNICGRKNTPIVGAPLSGQDMTTKKYVFFLKSCDLEIKNLRVNSVALCVSSCPQEQLNSLEDIQLFAKNNDSCLCVYNINATSCVHSSKVAELCPTLPVPQSVSFPLFNRCVPQNAKCYSQFTSVLINVANEVDIFHRVLSGIMAGRETVIGLCILALAFSVIMTVTFRFISMLLIHIFLTLLVFGLLFVSGIMWWLYYNYTNEPSIELETEKENMKLLLAFSIISSTLTVVLLFLILILRKRIHLTIQLFQVANKIISNIPSLFFQPLWSFMILIFFWIYWVAVLLSLGTAGNAQVISQGQVEYNILFGIRYMWWYHLIGLIWTSEFILACQQMTVAGAVVTCFFNRNKSKPPSHPVLSSISVLFCYHLGTVVKGSFLITIVRIPRIILLSIYNILKEKENACARCMFKCCFCCFWCLERGLRYLNQNAYTATTINGTNFCTSAKDATLILAKNPTITVLINCFGDFTIFLGKVFVVCFTVFGGLMAFNYHRELHVWVVPLLLITFFAYLVAHSFLSVFETIVDVLFLCFTVDIETNDGTPERPYFMDLELMNFVYQSSKFTEESNQKSKKSRHNNEYGTELQPMTRP
ncbi:choline transporter-like protein 3 isoform X2 [Hemicordylus capensis]|nr:choline transporter-like protein 3 isoform X2 [Hemicordylus capensis]XP_053100947.1 choline transporter-like protein 3 isoform X2 [Hemicordylus capensis]XP_053100948.1 choline transporter-like protein 3 isoform X2 [Hemicordylus capensis]XP_053100949.1 choline transporter-like protein 3 isoform X2 [Hemicordylus capensis]XP_053100950.1 choline transporter-like protein 3 isoform X2 [Hemicordylus capensis]XP_053100951.1 choline transporter-like protein 3 isoform X2 [Hemicordylus capensis]XP_05